MIGQVVGSYRIEALLGQGGMGAVYRARDLRLGREVAIKVLLEGAAASPDARARFVQEAQAMASLVHPGIVAVHEVGCAPRGEPYIVMDFVAGESLEDLAAREGPLPPERVAEIGAQVADALAAAHAQACLHRDVKPGNVLLTSEGRALLADFGLVKIAEGQGLTQTGHMVGTPLFAPPEQLAAGEVDERADLYSLGATLYVLLAGGQPFDVELGLIELANAIVTVPPRPFAEHGVTVPLALERIVLSCLAKARWDRPESASGLAELLRAYLRGEDPLRPERKPPWRVLGALTLASLLVIGVSAKVGASRRAAARARDQLSAALRPPGPARLAAAGGELAGWRAQLGPSEGRLELCAGLLALTRGDLAEARARAEALGVGSVSGEELSALRGGIAALSSEAPQQAIRDLRRAREAGLSFTELLEWEVGAYQGLERFGPEEARGVRALLARLADHRAPTNAEAQLWTRATYAAPVEGPTPQAFAAAELAGVRWRGAGEAILSQSPRPEEALKLLPPGPAPRELRARARPFALTWGEALGRPFPLNPEEIRDLSLAEFREVSSWLDLARRLGVAEDLGPGWSARARRFLLRENVYTTGGRGPGRSAFFAAAGLAFPADGQLQARLLSWLPRLSAADFTRVEVLVPAWRASCADRPSALAFEAWLLYHRARGGQAAPEQLLRAAGELRAELRALELPASFPPAPLFKEVARHYPDQLALLDYAEGRALLNLGRGTRALLVFRDLEGRGPQAFPDERWRIYQLEASLRDAHSRGARLRPVGLAGLALLRVLPRNGAVLRHAQGVVWSCRAELEPAELGALADAVEANRSGKPDLISSLQAAWLRASLGQSSLAASLLDDALEAAEGIESTRARVLEIKGRVQREPGAAAWGEIPRFLEGLGALSQAAEPAGESDR